MHLIKKLILEDLSNLEEIIYDSEERNIYIILEK